VEESCDSLVKPVLFICFLKCLEYYREGGDSVSGFINKTRRFKQVRIEMDAPNCANECFDFRRSEALEAFIALLRIPAALFFHIAAPLDLTAICPIFK
jgi:hypothetical protein